MERSHSIPSRSGQNGHSPKRAARIDFAQDASFNRGAYRALEDRWAKEIKAGHRVFVDIIAHYEGTSSRPDSLTVAWIIDGKRERKKISKRKQRQVK